jgi:hypothetical protein
VSADSRASTGAQVAAWFGSLLCVVVVVLAVFAAAPPVN